jgi:hypothetical protein
MKTPLARLNDRYADSKRQLGKAEEAVRRVSKQRLAELMRLAERERFEQLDDPDLTKLDRAKLRRSIGASLQHGKMELWALRGGFRWRRLMHWFRYRGTMAMTVAAVATPLCVLAAIAWKNSGEVIVLPSPIALDWKLPSGAAERTILAAGDRLVIVSQAGNDVARRWIKNQATKDQGYAISPVNIDRHLLP